MNYFKSYLKENFSLVALSAFWLVALLNPVFKKYDYGAEFPLVILLGILVFVIFFAERKKLRENNIFEQLLVWIFILMTILSFIFSETKNVGLSEVLAFISGMLLYLNYSNRKIPFINSFARIVLVGALLATTFGFLSYFSQPETRMFGTFFNILYPANRWPNAFASFLLIAWPLVLLFRNKKHNLGLAVVVSMFISALFLTYSRGALIAFLGQILLLAIYYLWPLGKTFFKRIGFSLLALLFSLSFFFFANYVRSLGTTDVIDVTQKIEFQNNEELTSRTERVDFWVGAIKLMAKRPWIGLGPSSFRYEYNRIQKTFLGNSDHPHNIFLKIGMENGVIAMIAFVLLLLNLLNKTAKNFHKFKKSDRETVYVLAVAVLGILAHNMIDYNFNFFANLIPLFMFLAFIRSISVKHENTARPKTEVMFAFILALLCIYEGFVLCLAYGLNERFTELSLYPRQYYTTHATRSLRYGYMEDAEKFISAQLALNKKDGQIYYLKSALEFQKGNFAASKSDLKQAIKLNPMNDLSYYRDYVGLLGMDNDPNLYSDDKQIIEKSTKILETYFGYVQNDIHSTAYTDNVEAAYDLAGYLSPYLPEQKAGEFLVKRQIMMDTANALRATKRF
ncbi:MAG: O-antigen ligase family protein [Candidatus Gracilibacteria bacterium]|jgi:O-antigen ligase